MKKILTFSVDSIVDLITNSSSELFVLKGDTKAEVIAMIEAIYPEFRSEYEEPISIDEMTDDQLNVYMSYMCSAHCWPASKDQYPVPPGFTFEELYEKEEGEESWNRGQYELRNNARKEESGNKWAHGYVTPSNSAEIRRKLDPESKTYFLFSLGDNPNWEMQQELEQISSRYHLG